MADIRFPYDLPSYDALVELIRRERPSEDIQKDFLIFGDMFFAPTDEEPGRTYIEMTNLRTGKKRPFVYRRLDINPVLRQYTLAEEPYIGIEIDGEITSAKILAEINRKFKMHLNHDDVEVSNKPLTAEDNTVYTMYMLPKSYAYYGFISIYVNTTPDALNHRLLEDGTVRLMEDGRERLLEDE